MFKLLTWIIACTLVWYAGSLAYADWSRLSQAKPVTEDINWFKLDDRRESLLKFFQNDVLPGPESNRLDVRFVESSTGNDLHGNFAHPDDITFKIFVSAKKFDQLAEAVQALERELNECHVRKVELVDKASNATRGFVTPWELDGTNELRLDLVTFFDYGLSKDDEPTRKPSSARNDLLAATARDLEAECRRRPECPHLRLAWGVISLELSGRADLQLASLTRLEKTSQDRENARLARQFKEILLSASGTTLDKKKANNYVQFLSSNTCENVFSQKLKASLWSLAQEGKKAKAVQAEMRRDAISDARDLVFTALITLFAIVSAAAAIRYERLRQQQEVFKESPSRAHVVRWVVCLVLSTVTGVLLVSVFHSSWGDADVVNRSDAVLAYTHPIKAAWEMAMVYALFFTPFLVWSHLLVGKLYNDEFLQLIKLRVSTITFSTKRLIGIGMGLGALDWAATSTLCLAAVMVGFPEGSSTGTEGIIFGSQSTVAISISVLTACILAPIFEEAIFRGLFYAWLRRSWPMIPAMVVTSIIFALAHMDFGLVAILTRATIGVLSAYGYEKTRSILPGIIAHSLHNSMCCLMMLI